MKHLLSTLTVILALSSTAFAQDLGTTSMQALDSKKGNTTNKDTVGWTYNGNITIGANQGMLHNWAAGGEIFSLTLNGLVNANATYYHHRSIWSNQLDAAYGIFFAYSNSFQPRKTDDRIDFTSKYGYRISPTKDFYFVFLGNFRTQFTKGYDYTNPDWKNNPTSNFFSPLYITLAPGVEYRKGDMFSIFFSPLSARLTFVDKYYTSKDPKGAFGVDFNKSFRPELGAYLTTRFQKDFNKVLSYKTRLDLYSNYLAKDTKDPSGAVIKQDSPGNIDIMWDNLLVVKFAKYFSVNFGLTAIYDNDVPYSKTYVNEQGQTVVKDDPTSGLGWWQIKQLFNVGFNYKF